jgi:hypothetical protein
MGRAGWVGRVGRAGLIVLVTMLTPAWALAQGRFDAGAHVAVARSSEFDTTDTGIGGWFSWHPISLVGAEAEMTVYPTSFPNANGFSSSRIEGLFGATVGPRLGGFRPFARLRPGFVTFRGEPTICILIFPPPLSCQLDGRRVFALDVGGGIEVFAGTRLLLRLDAGDRLMKYPGPSFRGAGQIAADDFYSHDFRMSVGAGVRF